MLMYPLQLKDETASQSLKSTGGQPAARGARMRPASPSCAARGAVKQYL